jgi:hypothetical protein
LEARLLQAFLGIQTFLGSTASSGLPWKMKPSDVDDLELGGEKLVHFLFAGGVDEGVDVHTVIGLTYKERAFAPPIT